MGGRLPRREGKECGREGTEESDMKDTRVGGEPVMLRGSGVVQ